MIIQFFELTLWVASHKPLIAPRVDQLYFEVIGYSLLEYRVRNMKG